MILKTTSAAVALLMLCAGSSHALEKCGVRIDKKTGVLSVSASGVSGTLHWGSSVGAETETFFNAATCVADGKASKCQIADPATLAAKTPPSGCTLYLDDDGAPCSAWIAGCTPGSRTEPVCGDGQAATGEDCDGLDLNGQTCQSAGFLYGTLACSACALDTTGCTDARFHDNGDGTITDHQTNLMWEKKTGTLDESGIVCPGPDCTSVHEVDNNYAWSTGAPYNPDGPAFFDFLAALNGPTPFAGHDDWRLPTVTELESIQDCSGGGRCINPIFGPTALVYWSASTVQGSTSQAWAVVFGFVETLTGEKAYTAALRAVRSAS